MARSALVVLLAITMVTATVTRPAQADSYEFDIAPDSDMSPDSYDSDIIYSPEPSANPGAVSCASKITLDCSMELMANDFFQVHVEARCCRQVVLMGKTCNDLLVDIVLAEFDINNRVPRRCTTGVIIFGTSASKSRLSFKSKPVMSP